MAVVDMTFTQSYRLIALISELFWTRLHGVRSEVGFEILSYSFSHSFLRVENGENFISERCEPSIVHLTISWQAAWWCWIRLSVCIQVSLRSVRNN